MGKITGMERPQEVPAKVMLLYEAVARLIAEETDVSSISVSNITEKAGIGKGTAYEYFDSKEDILTCAIIFYVQQLYERIDLILRREPSFCGRLDALLGEMDRGEEQDKECEGMRYVHIMTDHSGLGRMVMAKLQEAPLCRYLPGAVLERIICEGIQAGEVRDDLPLEYMVCTLLSKFMAYIMCTAKIGPVQMERDQVRPYLMQSLKDEFLVGECRLKK